MLSPLNQAFLRGAAETSSAVYAAAVTRLQLRARKIASFWSSYDLLLTPTLAMPPVPVGWEAEPDDPWEQFDRAVQFTPFTAAFNVTGQPAVSLPLHWTDTGLPIGVQLVGPPLGDALLLRVASQIEEARPWAGQEAAALVKRTSGTVIPLRERPYGPGDLQTLGLDASQSRPTLILIDCPARACSISAAFPLVIATDMFR